MKSFDTKLPSKFNNKTLLFNSLTLVISSHFIAKLINYNMLIAF